MARRHTIRSVGAIALVALVALVAAACAASSAKTTTALPTSGPVRVMVSDDHFELSFEVSSQTLHAGEELTGTATLRLVQPDRMTAWGSGSGLIGFRYVEVGGDRHVDWIRTADCAPHRIAGGTPIVTGLTKTAAYSADAGPTDFYRVFGSDPDVHLPPGVWRISALTDFTEGEGCGGVPHKLDATIEIHVVS